MATCNHALACDSPLSFSHAINLQVRTASCSGTACVNSFGDEQLAVDMLADKLLFESLKYSVRFSSYAMHPVTRLPLADMQRNETLQMHARSHMKQLRELDKSIMAAYRHPHHS